ncbi:hypothetical protein C8R41DRAFT_820028 [Lentinula lateritia]|uniref:Uncharacterized protein n=1 Tax=Lentinula lateritia TaxID=40482 RepID=A0ABQ8VNE1_9AGAR|nr:hypothetical protein C8R41DRAFT_820028 [Lentinula lateritia]
MPPGYDEFLRVRRSTLISNGHSIVQGTRSAPQTLTSLSNISLNYHKMNHGKEIGHICDLRRTYVDTYTAKLL